MATAGRDTFATDRLQSTLECLRLYESGQQLLLFTPPLEGRVNSAAAIATFDAFATQYANTFVHTQIPCLVILDNAPIHTSQAFLSKQEEWMMSGLVLYF